MKTAELLHINISNYEFELIDSAPSSKKEDYMEMCEEEGDNVEIKTEATETDDVTIELRADLIYAVDNCQMKS